MRKAYVLTTVVMFIAAFGLYGCGSKPESANSKEAIEQAKALADAEAQARYLLKEAKAFISTEQYKEAMNTAQYVARNFEDSSSEAQKIVEQATAEIKAEAQKKMDEVKGKLGNIGN